MSEPGGSEGAIEGGAEGGSEGAEGGAEGGIEGGTKGETKEETEGRRVRRGPTSATGAGEGGIGTPTKDGARCGCFEKKLVQNLRDTLIGTQLPELWRSWDLMTRETQ